MASPLDLHIGSSPKPILGRPPSEMSLPDMIISPEIEISSFSAGFAIPASRSMDLVTKFKDNSLAYDIPRSYEPISSHGSFRSSSSASDSIPFHLRDSLPCNAVRGRDLSMTQWRLRPLPPTPMQKAPSKADSVAAKIKNFENLSVTKELKGTVKTKSQQELSQFLGDFAQSPTRISRSPESDAEHEQHANKTITATARQYEPFDIPAPTARSFNTTFTNVHWSLGSVKSSTPSLATPSREQSPLSKVFRPHMVPSKSEASDPIFNSFPATPSQPDFYTAPSSPVPTEEQQTAPHVDMLPPPTTFPPLPTTPVTPPTVAPQPVTAALQPSRATSIRLSSGAVLNVIPPPSNPWGIAAYRHGTIRVSSVLTALRKDSIATIVGFWEDDARKGAFVAPFGGSKRQEMAVVNEIVDFFEKMFEIQESGV